MQHRVLGIPSMGCLPGSTLGHRVAGEHCTIAWDRRESRGDPSQPALLEQGRGVVGTSRTWLSSQAQATSGLLLQPLASACTREWILLPAGTTPGSCCCWHRELGGGFCTGFHALLAVCYLSSLLPGCAQILPAYLNSHLFSHKIHFSPAALCCYDNRLALLLLSHPCFSCIRTLPSS